MGLPPTPAKKTTRTPHPNKTQYNLLHAPKKSLTQRRRGTEKKVGKTLRSLRLCVRHFTNPNKNVTTTNAFSPTFAAPPSQRNTRSSPIQNTPRQNSPTFAPILGAPHQSATKVTFKGRVATQYKVKHPDFCTFVRTNPKQKGLAQDYRSNRPLPRASS